MNRIGTFLLFALTYFFSIVMVDANDIIQILFDENHADACNDDEWWQIDNAIYVLSQHQRSLRSDTEIQEENFVDHTNRMLWSNSCPNKCAGYPVRCCKALNCKGYRSRNMVEAMTRGLFWATPCQNQISELNNLINNMRNTRGFSKNCKWYLGLNREYNCFTDEYCGTEEPPAQDITPTDDGW